MPYATVGEGRGNSVINLGRVDRKWACEVRISAMRSGRTLRDFCVAAIERARLEVEHEQATTGKPAGERLDQAPTAGDKLAAALPAISAQARVPIAMTTGAALLQERTRTIEAEPEYDDLPPSRK